MPTTTFVARRPEPFSALVEAPQIGGLGLDPHPPVRVLDRYFDTDDGVLLRRGLALRVRERGADAVASLRRLEGGPPLAPDLDLAAASSNAPLALPPSPLADAVARVTGGEAVRQLLAIRLYRTPRLVLDGGRPAGVVSFDVVIYEVPGARVVSNEVEVEPAPDASLDALFGPFLEADLERVDRSRLERAVLRLPRGLDEPALLLPDEHAALEAAAVRDDDRGLRARVVLLDGRGFRTDTIAGQTGLSMGRVRTLRRRFREARLAVLDDDPAPPPPAPLGAPAPAPRLRAPEDAEDMDDLLDLFSAHGAPDTPLFSGNEPEPPRRAPRPAPAPALASVPAEPVAPAPVSAAPVVEPEPVAAVAPPPPSAPSPPPLVRPRFDPYPVVLGPVPMLAADSQGDGSRPTRRPAAPETDAPALDGDSPVLEAAHALLVHRTDRFEARAERFVLTRAPSDARRLLVATHGVRIAVETFDGVLPEAAAARVVAGLRPLATALSAALDVARAAAATGRPDLARLAAERVSRAADRLGGDPTAWTARARRLVARLAAEPGLRSDDAPLSDDFVGAPGDAPTPTRLRHVLGSVVWSRYEDVLAFEDDLAAPTPELAGHLAVALSTLHEVVELAGGDREVRAALAAAERAVVEARGRDLAARLAGGASQRPLGVLPDVWRPLAGPAFRERLGRLVAAV